jgi:hypothetical protein
VGCRGEYLAAKDAGVELPARRQAASTEHGGMPLVDNLVTAGAFIYSSVAFDTRFSV